MRRARLIWFAVGAATSSLIAMLSFFAIPRPTAAEWRLRIEEPNDISDARWAAMSPKEVHEMQYRSAEIARSCGANEFRSIAPSDGGPFTEVRLARVGDAALNCILREAAAKQMPVMLDRMATR